MVKKLLLVVLVGFIPFLLFASYQINSVSNGTEGMSVVSTKYFDIVYRQKSPMAELLYSNADLILENVCNRLDYDLTVFIKKRIPVVITDSQYLLNAYYTSWPYIHIVMYDTLGRVDPLTSNKNQQLGIFEHEVTHLVQMNIKQPWMWSLSKLIPSLSIQSLHSSKMTIEGTAVMSESEGGYGRLNCPSYIKEITQAAIEGKFPTLSQIKGSWDTNPYGMSYMYGGAFIDYLRRTYSDETYNLYLKENIKLFTTEDLSFKRIFGLSMSQAYENFKAQIIVPEVVQPDMITDQDRKFDSLKSYDGLVTVWDGFHSALYSVSKQGLGDEILAFHTSYPETGILNGGKLAVSVVGSTVRKVIIYNNGIKEHVFENCRFATACGDGILTWTEYCGESILTLWDSSYNQICSLNLGYSVTASFACTLDDGRTAMITAVNDKRSIVIINPESKTIYRVENPLELEFTGLSANGNTLCFSYTSVLNCYGELILKSDSSAEYRISKKLYNGGICNPVCIEDSVLFISEFFSSTALSVEKRENLELEEPVSAEIVPYSAPSCEAVIPESEIRPYKPLECISGFSLFPFAMTDLSSLTSFSSFKNFGLGLSFLTCDPTETYVFFASAGYNPFSKQNFISAFIENSSNSFPVSFKAVVSFPDFSSYAALKSGKTFTLDSTAEKIVVSNTLELASESGLTSFADLLYFSYSNVRDWGGSVFTNTAFETMASCCVVGDFTNGVANVVGNAAFAYHFPVSFVEDFYVKTGGSVGTSSVFSTYSEAGITPFCLEIQKNLWALYFKRLIFSTSYRIEWVPSYNSVNRIASGVLYFQLSPCTGCFASSNVNLGVRVIKYSNQSKLTFSPVCSLSF